MDVIASTGSSGLKGGKRAERLFFSSYILLIALLILYGFAPSFYLRGAIEPRAPLVSMRPDIVVHGLIATAFLAMMALQPLLIAGGKRVLHMRIGNWAFGLGIVMALSLYVVSVFSQRAFAAPVPGAAEAMGSLSLFTVLAYVWLLWAAWRTRFDAPAHKRFVIALACLITGPALARMPFMPPPPMGVPVINATIVALLLPLWLWDIARSRRLHRATIQTTAIVAGMLLGGILVGMSPIARPLIAILPGFGWP